MPEAHGGWDGPSQGEAEDFPPEHPSTAGLQLRRRERVQPSRSWAAVVRAQLGWPLCVSAWCTRKPGPPTDRPPPAVYEHVGYGRAAPKASGEGRPRPCGWRQRSRTSVQERNQRVRAVTQVAKGETLPSIGEGEIG